MHSRGGRVSGGGRGGGSAATRGGRGGRTSLTPATAPSIENATTTTAEKKKASAAAAPAAANDNADTQGQPKFAVTSFAELMRRKKQQQAAAAAAESSESHTSETHTSETTTTTATPLSPIKKANQTPAAASIDAATAQPQPPTKKIRPTAATLMQTPTAPAPATTANTVTGDAAPSAVPSSVPVESSPSAVSSVAPPTSVTSSPILAPATTSPSLGPTPVSLSAMREKLLQEKKAKEVAKAKAALVAAEKQKLLATLKAKEAALTARKEAAEAAKQAAAAQTAAAATANQVAAQPTNPTIESTTITPAVTTPASASASIQPAPSTSLFGSSSFGSSTPSFGGFGSSSTNLFASPSSTATFGSTTGFGSTNTHTAAPSATFGGGWAQPATNAVTFGGANTSPPADTNTPNPTTNTTTTTTTPTTTTPSPSSGALPSISIPSSDLSTSVVPNKKRKLPVGDPTIAAPTPTKPARLQRPSPASLPSTQQDFSISTKTPMDVDDSAAPVSTPLFGGTPVGVTPNVGFVSTPTPASSIAVGTTPTLPQQSGSERKRLIRNPSDASATMTPNPCASPIFTHATSTHQSTPIPTLPNNPTNTQPPTMMPTTPAIVGSGGAIPAQSNQQQPGIDTFFGRTQTPTKSNAPADAPVKTPTLARVRSKPAPASSSAVPTAAAATQPASSTVVPSDADLAAWDAEVQSSMMAIDQPASLPTTTLPLKAGLHLPFAVVHEDERKLFNAILAPRTTTTSNSGTSPNGYLVNYDALDAWIAETESIIDRTFQQVGLPQPYQTQMEA